MPKMVTLKQHRWKGKIMLPGDEYEAVPGQDRRVAMALGWSKDAPPELPKPVYATRAMPKAETSEEVTAPAAKKVAAKKSTYGTRRLTAEE